MKKIKEILNNKNNYKYILSFVLIIVLLVMVGGISYAIFDYSITGTKENVITTGEIKVAFAEQNNIKLQNRYAETDTQGLANTDPNSQMTFTVSSDITGEATVNYAVGLVDIVEGATLTQDYVKIYLEKNGTVANNFTENTGKTVKSFKNYRIIDYLDSHVIAQGSVTGTQTDTYRLKAWIDENYNLPKTDTSNSNVHSNTTTSETFSFKIKVVGIDSALEMDIITPTVYAVYSDDDESLTFYNTTDTITKGEIYRGKTASRVYTGFEKETYSSEDAVPWHGSRMTAKSVTVADEGIAPVSTAYWFYEFTDCTSFDLAKLDTTNVTSMFLMFGHCYALTSLDLSTFNTSNVTNMTSMFVGSSNLATLDLSNFDTQNVTSMNSMFHGCLALTELDLSSFNTQNVTTMKGMFGYCYVESITFGENWNTAKVTDMSNMFYDCRNLTSLDLSNFNTSNVTTMKNMFWGCSKLVSLDLSKFDTSNVTDMSYMFYCCAGSTSIIFGENWNTANVTNMSNMFYGCDDLTSLDLSKFNTANVIDMSYMFLDCFGLTSLDLSTFDTSNVTTMKKMFGSQYTGCSALTSITFGENWNTANVTDMSYMFGNCKMLKLDCSDWNVDKVTSHSNFNYRATGVIAPTWVN